MTNTARMIQAAAQNVFKTLNVTSLIGSSQGKAIELQSGPETLPPKVSVNDRLKFHSYAKNVLLVSS